MCLTSLPGSHHPGGRAEVHSFPISWSQLLPVHSSPGASLLWASTQPTHISEHWICMPCGQRPCLLPHPDNPIQPTWTLASETMFGRIPASSSQESAGVQVCDILHRHLFTSLLMIPHWGAGEGQQCLERPWCFTRLLCTVLLHPDQLCHQEEIGSNIRGSQCQVGKGAGVLPCLSPLKPVLRLP